MGTRSLAAGVTALVVSLGLIRLATADPKSDIAQKTKDAMASYDMMDYEAAKKLLNKAITAAKTAKLDKDPLLAKLYLNLGIATFAGGDQDGAKLAFFDAVQIDGKIQIPPDYRQPALVALLEQARTEAGGAAAPAGPPGVDCTTVKGFQHTIIDTGKTNVNEPIEVLVGADVQPAKVSAMYRTEGATEFVEVKLTKQGDCKYTGAIPGAAKKGSLLHYYVAAYDASNKVIANKGAAGSPNIMELVAGPAAPPGGGDDEDPINGSKKKPPPPKKPPPAGTGDGSGGAIGGGVTVPGKPPKIYVGVNFGTGFAYVTGKTEFDNEVENCCIGSSLLVIQPEVGYHVNPKLAIGLAARIGIPVGANLDGHSTLAPGAVVRVRYWLSASGDGVRVMGQLGGGILRNTIKLNNAMDGMDTDIVGQGPLFLGGGVGYTKRLAGNFSFVAELSALSAIAVVKNLGSAPNLNSGLAADLSLGVAVGF